MGVRLWLSRGDIIIGGVTLGYDYGCHVVV